MAYQMNSILVSAIYQIVVIRITLDKISIKEKKNLHLVPMIYKYIYIIIWTSLNHGFWEIKWENLKRKRQIPLTCFPRVRTTYGSLDIISLIAKFIPFFTLTFTNPINSTMPSCNNFSVLSKYEKESKKQKRQNKTNHILWYTRNSKAIKKLCGKTWLERRWGCLPWCNPQTRFQKLLKLILWPMRIEIIMYKHH